MHASKKLLGPGRKSELDVASAWVNEQQIISPTRCSRVNGPICSTIWSPYGRIEGPQFEKSLGVVLPKEVISRLGTKAGASLHLTETPDGGYRLVPHDPSFENKMAKAEDIIGRHRNALQGTSNNDDFFVGSMAGAAGR
jgi:hypothetical protein